MRNEYLNIQHPDQYSSPRLREINRSPDSQDSELHLAWLAVELVKRRRRILITGIRFERERERNKRSFFFYEQETTIRKRRLRIIPSVFEIRLFRNLIFLSTSSKYNSSINFDKIRSVSIIFYNFRCSINRKRNTYMYIFQICLERSLA